MHQNCNDCSRLWNEYALATRHFLKLSGKLEIAESSNDARSAQELRPMVEQAAVERDELRQQIDQHERMTRVRAEGLAYVFSKAPIT